MRSSDFSKTAIKALKRMSKEQLVKMVIELSNYAEQQKAANIILGNAMNEVTKKRAAYLEAAATQPAEEAK